LTLLSAALSFLENKNAHVAPDDMDLLDFVERLAGKMHHPALMEASVMARRRMTKAQIVVRRKARIDDVVVARMDGDAAAAAAAMKALDDDDAALMKITAEEAAAERLRGARK
jgi:hypothetical protein